MSGLQSLHLKNRHTETIIQKDTSTPVFTATLLTIAKKWKQPPCPWTDEWIKEDGVHIYNGVVLSHEKGMPFAATAMDLEAITLSEVSQIEKDIYDLTRVESNFKKKKYR